MADYKTKSAPGTTTIIERRGSGGTIAIAIVLLIAVLVAGYFLMARENGQSAKDAAITSAAQSVGSAAEKAGDAAQTAANK